MKYDDLSFDIINKDGLKVTCDITMVVPNPDNSNEPYVMYTDYTLDENDDFITMYGKIVDENGTSSLVKIEDRETITRIIELSKDEIIQYVNKQVQDNIS